MKRLVLLIIVLCALLSCQKSSKDQSDNTIHFPLSSQVSTLDPAVSYDTVSATIVYQVYETLFEYEYLKRPYSLRPLLAEKMPIVEKNGLRYTIKIKKGVLYHQNKALPKGRTVKAQDFINQIKRLAFTPVRSGGLWLFEGKIKGLTKFKKQVGSDIDKLLSTKIEGLHAPDEHTLVIELEKAYPQILYALAMAFTAPIPEEAIKFYKNDFSAVEVGTGPFYLEKWERSSQIILLRNQQYRKASYPRLGDRYANQNNFLKDAGQKIPFLDKVHFHVMKESQTRWLNFLSKKIDLLILDKDNYKTAIDPLGGLSKELKSKKINLQVAPTLTYWWLAFNMKDKYVGLNKDLRKAISYAVNRDEYIRLFTNNVGQKANSIFPPGIPGYNPSDQLPYDYNIEKAKAYLVKAGFPNGEGLPTLTYDVRGNSTTSRQIGEFIQKELKKIGININIVVNTFPGFLRKLKSGQLQFWLGGWAMDYPDAENIVQLLISKNHPPGPNYTYYSNPKVDQYYQELSAKPDNIFKFELMNKVQSQVNEDLPWSMLYYTRNYIIQHERIENYRFSDIIYNYFKYIKIKAD